jgi:hypothetical protein
MICMPSAANTASSAAVNLVSRSLIKKRSSSSRVPMGALDLFKSILGGEDDTQLVADRLVAELSSVGGVKSMRCPEIGQPQVGLVQQLSELRRSQAGLTQNGPQRAGMSQLRMTALRRDVHEVCGFKCPNDFPTGDLRQGRTHAGIHRATVFAAASRAGQRLDHVGDGGHGAVPAQHPARTRENLRPDRKSGTPDRWSTGTSRRRTPRRPPS